MNENGYKVMHIEDGVDSKYGNIHIIMANLCKTMVLKTLIHIL